MMHQVYRAVYVSLFLHFLRKILSRREMERKIAWRQYELRVEKFTEEFRAKHKDPFLAPIIPFEAPEGYVPPERHGARW